MKRLVAALALLILPALAIAAPLTSAKVTDMDSAIVDLSLAAANQGYELVKVQKIDRALVKLGYVDPGVRVAFIGKADQVELALGDDPALLSLLPLRIVLTREGEEIRISSDDLEQWERQLPAARTIIQSWERDLAAILADFVVQ